MVTNAKKLESQRPKNFASSSNRIFVTSKINSKTNSYLVKVPKLKRRAMLNHWLSRSNHQPLEEYSKCLKEEPNKSGSISPASTKPKVTQSKKLTKELWLCWKKNTPRKRALPTAIQLLQRSRKLMKATSQLWKECGTLSWITLNSDKRKRRALAQKKT